MEKFILKNNHLNFAAISRFNLTYLKVLDLSHNKLNGTLSKNSFQFSNTLRSLDLSFNSLKKLTDKCFTNFPKLKTLNLESNEIEVITPMAFQGLQRLRRLDLSFNGILEIPLNVFNGLKGLEYLDLSSNHLQVNYSILQTAWCSSSNSTASFEFFWLKFVCHFWLCSRLRKLINNIKRKFVIRSSQFIDPEDVLHYSRLQNKHRVYAYLFWGKNYGKK